MSIITGNSAGALESSATDAASSTKHTTLQDSPPYLPDKPLVIIQPRPSWVALSLRDLWGYRELLYFLMWRDIKVRYKQTALGMVWVILQPILTTAVFTIFLGRLVGLRSEGVPYPLFVLAGMLLWTFFTAAVSVGGNSIVGNAHLVTKVYFPRLILPIAAVVARLLDFAVASIILGGLMVYYRIGLTWNILLLPVAVALIMLFALGVGMMTSALNVKYRDVGVIIPVVLQLWMFASPVVYPVELVPQNWQWLYALNPLVGIFQVFRASLFGQSFNWMMLAVSITVTLLLLVCAAFSFRRMETHFADIV